MDPHSKRNVAHTGGGTITAAVRIGRTIVLGHALFRVAFWGIHVVYYNPTRLKPVKEVSPTSPVIVGVKRETGNMKYGDYVIELHLDKTSTRDTGFSILCSPHLFKESRLCKNDTMSSSLAAARRA